MKNMMNGLMKEKYKNPFLTNNIDFYQVRG